MFKFIRKYKKTIFTFLAEILVVIIGISITMYIEAWRLSEQNEIKEANYLEDLYYDVTDDLSRLNERINHMSAGRTRIRILLNAMHFPDSMQLSSLEFQTIIGRSFRLETFSSRDYSFQEITSTGNMKLIKNEKIRKLLYSYYGAIKDLNDIEDLNNKISSEMFTNDLTQIFPSRHLFHFNSTFDGVEELTKIDLSFFRDPNSEKYLHLENVMLARAHQLSQESHALFLCATSGVALRNLLGASLKIPNEESFVLEMIRTNKSANELLEEYREKYPEYILLEANINNIIYQAIDTMPELALDLALLNAKNYPDDANVFVTLGDCYLACGDKKNALLNFEKALSMDLILVETKEKIEALKER
jgi:tetratricopeptide (TPR) repeat protein